jgi:hypothetical protein
MATELATLSQALARVLAPILSGLMAKPLFKTDPLC